MIFNKVRHDNQTRYKMANFGYYAWRLLQEDGIKQPHELGSHPRWCCYKKKSDIVVL